MESGARILSVSEITRKIRAALEGGFGDVAIRGEISNFKRHTSGHLYFTLKDESCQIQGVVWRSRAAGLFFTPQDGMNVVAHGRVTVYEARGVYQLDVVRLQPLGAGELQLAFERLKQKLAAEGLFDASRKKPLPPYPERIGVVTSPTGAAIQDILHVLARRFPVAGVILNPVRVQGEGAASEIAAAIRDFDEYGGVDVLIVGRGGGSLEDLWAFNEEEVARAIADCSIPVVSAVGHETDVTIADFAADVRAPTPSAAAEMVVPLRTDVIEFVRDFCYTIQRTPAEMVRAAKEKIRSLLRSHAFSAPADLARQFGQRHDEARRSMDRSVLHHLAMRRQMTEAMARRLEALNPNAILSRGYAIVRREGEMIRSAGQLRQGDPVAIAFHDGSVPAKVV